MQNVTTSSALLVQTKLVRMIADVIELDPELIEREIEEYLDEHGISVPGFTYDRNSIVASTWIIDHNLDKYPQVTLIDDDGNEFDADILYNSLNQITVVFGQPTAGKAVLI